MSDTPETPQRTTEPTTAEQRAAWRQEMRDAASAGVQFIPGIEQLLGKVRHLLDDADALTARVERVEAERDWWKRRADDAETTWRGRMAALSKDRDRLAREHAALRDGLHAFGAHRHGCLHVEPRGCTCGLYDLLRGNCHACHGAGVVCVAPGEVYQDQSCGLCNGSGRAALTPKPEGEPHADD